MVLRRLAAVGWSICLAGGALLLLFQVVRAAPAFTSQNRFVAANGAGIQCSQSTPCEPLIALILANDGDTLFFQHGVYTGGGANVLAVSASITLAGGWSGNPSGPVTVNPALYPTIIDGQNQRRGIFVGTSITPTIEGFVIQNGNATGLVNSCSVYAAAGCGGGMFVDHAAAHVLRNTFLNNTALITTNEFASGNGGGLHLEWADGAVISANLFSGNSAVRSDGFTQGTGGGLSATGHHTTSLTITNNTFTANTAYWGGGAGLHQADHLVVAGNVFQNNAASLGGGLYGWIASGAITGNTLRGNSGDAAAYLGYYGGTFGANWLVDNATTAGLKLVDDYGSNTVVAYNNILAHNGSVGIEAGAYISFPLQVFALNNTLVGSGSGTGLLLSNGYVTITADNNIIAGFSTGVWLSYPVTSTVNALYTLFDSVTTAGNASFTHTVVGAASFVDPLHRDYHLAFNSAARDSGGATLLNTDIDGDPRPLGAGTDIGAVETRFVHGLFLPLLRR